MINVQYFLGTSCYAEKKTVLQIDAWFLPILLLFVLFFISFNINYDQNRLTIVAVLFYA